MTITDAEFKAWVADYEAHEPAAWIVQVDPAEAERIARTRQHGMSGGRGDHFIADGFERDRIGAFGELATAKRFGLTVRVAADGDGGADFRVSYPPRQPDHPPRIVAIDVKTRVARANSDCLMVEERLINKTSADWLVMCHLLEDSRVQLLGWEQKSIMTLHPPRDFGYHKPTHARPFRQLRPMYQLEYLLGLRNHD